VAVSFADVKVLVILPHVTVVKRCSSSRDVLLQLTSPTALDIVVQIVIVQTPSCLSKCVSQL
jgi:hypothetical protein